MREESGELPDGGADHVTCPACSFVPLSAVERAWTYRGAGIKIWLRTRALRVAITEAMVPLYVKLLGVPFKVDDLR